MHQHVVSTYISEVERYILTLKVSCCARQQQQEAYNVEELLQYCSYFSNIVTSESTTPFRHCCL